MRTAVSIGGAIMSAVISAAGLAFNAFNIRPDIEWKWIASIAFLVFVVIVWQGWAASETRAKRLEHSNPNLIWLENRGFNLFAKYNDPTNNVIEGDYLHFAVQIWFKNSPIMATHDAVAENVIATITFYDRTTKTALSIPACFIIAEARDHAGNTGERIEKISEWPPGELGKLQIATKRREEDSAFGWAKGDITAREIKRGSYYMKVILEGTRVIDFKPLWFTMVNHGINGDLSISDKPIKKPNLRKEGFQTE